MALFCYRNCGKWEKHAEMSAARCSMKIHTQCMTTFNGDKQMVKQSKLFSEC